MIKEWAHALKSAGLNVEALDGWQMRAASSYTYEPAGIMLHHTASNRNSGNMPCRNLVINGRKDLKGPLSQFLVGRNGDILLISGKRCNHAGRGMASRIEQLLADVEPPDYGQGLYDAPKPGAYRNGTRSRRPRGALQRRTIRSHRYSVCRVMYVARLEPVNPCAYA